MAGIYLHIPFCKQACNYCNFHFSTLLLTKAQVLAAMLEEIRLQQHFFPSKTMLHTIYFGGGTPSLLSIAEINTLFNCIEKYFLIAENAEITLEANPDDMTLEFLQQLKSETRINRLSIGIQSFLEADLQYMHRAHNATEAITAIKTAQAVGISNLSIDLIYGTPTLNDEMWRENLKIAFDLNIPHISCYALTVEEKTALASQIKKKKTSAPEDEKTSAHFFILMEEMQQHGYVHYEISNFCQPNHAAIHNSNYWKGLSYLGIGPSAHSFDGEKRYWNISNNALYAKAILENKFEPAFEILSKTDKYNEYIMTAIRTIKGVDSTYISVQFGDIYLQHFLAEIAAFIVQKDVVQTATTYTLTDKGKLFCDAISQQLFYLEE